jgi:hypothetical protein
MAGTEEQINAARRQLGVVISLTHGYVSQAAQLLESKARRSPATAEATAHSLLLQAKREMELWLRRSSAVLGVPPPEVLQEPEQPTPTAKGA